MTLIDLTHLFEPHRRLRIEREPGFWIVVGADGDTVYLRTRDVLFAVRFMRAFALKHGAEIDEASVSEALEISAWARAQESASPTALTAEQVFALQTNRLIDQLREDGHSRRVDAQIIPFPRKESA